MKNLLTPEQSAELIKRGVSADKASNNSYNYHCHYHEPIFTLADLLSLLPTSIMHGNFKMNIAHNSNGWNASYILWDSCLEGLYVRDEDGDMTADELIDALYELLLWCLDNNHVKLD